MEQKKFLYSDGRDVVVTHATLQTKKTSYQLKGVTDFGMAILKPQLLPGLLITLIGLTLIANGIWWFIPTSVFEFLSIPNEFATSSSIHFLIGTIITSIGITYLLLTRKRYALRIETAEGDKDVVVSKRKEYVDMILSAMKKAKSSSFRFK
jgi:hypothetical protein